jgi:hypothetical protein
MHRQLEEIMSNIISQMNGDKELISEWSTCLRLHSNFYENLMTEKDLRSSIELVENFVKNMERILTSNEGWSLLEFIIFLLMGSNLYYSDAE